MYDVIMKGFYDISYTVMKGVDIFKAEDIKKYLVGIWKDGLINDLPIRDVTIEPAK